ncbi:MAG TPA: STAS domain-containing protein [Solirubrobacteraceae bacterium]|jgi:anti-anti-sigma factor
MSSYSLPTESQRDSSPAVFGWMPFHGTHDVEHVAVGGHLCLATAGEFQQVFAAIRPGARVILLDLSAVFFLDSTGVHVIETAAAELRAQGRQLLVLPGGETIQRVFEITGARERLEFVDTNADLRELLAA